MKYYIGVDVGGTKCALTLGSAENDGIKIIVRREFKTKGTPSEVLEEFLCEIRKVLADSSLLFSDIASIGISCGGPLDAERGIVQSPPNLKGWDDVHITEFFESNTGIPAFLDNDANACAVAEWKFGAAKGKKNVIFLTFGTGLGAGLILDGRLYGGTNGNAGEIGHVRLRRSGPVGFGKTGSAEGFCSGGGIGRMGRAAAESDKNGAAALIGYAGGIENINAKNIAELAREGDEFCCGIYRRCGEMLGETLAILIDLLNPECIILGGVYMRSHDLLDEGMKKVLAREALDISSGVCEILPAGLGESIGDFAALSLAVYRKGIEK